LSISTARTDEEAQKIIKILVNEEKIDDFEPPRAIKSQLVKSRQKVLKLLGTAVEIDEKYVVPPVSPFDLFAIASTLISMSGAYHHFESEIKYIFPEQHHQINKIVTITKQDRDNWNNISEAWAGHKDTEEIEEGKFDEELKKLWVTILKNFDSHLLDLKRNAKIPLWWKDAFALMAIADGAASRTGFEFSHDNKCDTWPQLAQAIIEWTTASNNNSQTNIKYVESLSKANRSIVNVLPKSKTASLGCTLRSLSHNLARLPGSGTIRAGWAWTTNSAKENLIQKPIFNMLLIPYPYKIHSGNFQAVAVHDEPGSRWGKFCLNVDPNEDDDIEFSNFVSELILDAKKKVKEIHAIVLPELAVSRKTALRLKDICERDHPSVELLCAGVREDPRDDKKASPVNGAFIATFGTTNDKREALHEIFHEKHHRWRLTEDQILNYNLSTSLDPSRLWWEDIRTGNRKIPFIVMREKWVVTSLICEDLARNDPAKNIIESIGPNLVIALLMDGPQTTSRWPARYATVLADDPGSSVLSISSFGLIDRSNRPERNSKSFALWRDDKGKTTEIKLEDESHAVIASISEYPVNDITLDGRINANGASLRLTGLRQLVSPKYKGQRPVWDRKTKP